jgi:hypothetical protein
MTLWTRKSVRGGSNPSLLPQWYSSEHTSSDKTAFVRFITIFVAMIGFADTEHNSE